MWVNYRQRSFLSVAISLLELEMRRNSWPARKGAASPHSSGLQSGSGRIACQSCLEHKETQNVAAVDFKEREEFIRTGRIDSSDIQDKVRL
jgi:hypothetical protein